MQHAHITAGHNLLDLKLDEVWQYRDLVYLFTKRSFVVTYKQTILGPLWLFINPLLTSVVYVVLFGNIARLSTDGMPQLLFYLLGSSVWSYFSNCVSNNATIFISNANLFGKVYFPRLVIPISQVLSALVRLGIQMLLVLALLLYYVATGMLQPHWELWISVPLALLHLGVMGMGFGIIISSLTTRYRDLSVLVGFGISLWMYATPVVYPLSIVTGPLRKLILLNPVTAPMEYLRYTILGVGSVAPQYLALSWAVTLMVVLGGIALFNKVERTFMDTV
ncbi:MAG: ABC transporter permease [Atopobiaceae bacterium]|nr:ABC transporter permease [Atopobiaceae bacterium]